MATSTSEEIIDRIKQAHELYHRLVLIVGPSGSGKTSLLQEVSKQTGFRYINLNLELSRSLLELTERQRILKLPILVDEIIGKTFDQVVLIDNLEILFEVSLKQDPLRLLQQISRNRTVVASWNGTIAGGYLTYAAPNHPEYRRFPAHDLLVVTLEKKS
ncbi:MAG: BREX-3 system P-loop-containing protein BrxF [Deltaproteobacteria bacterium CG03_land_8_20_14_0_80_45_14]|nr:MAG: BREX-3 system P-loop-containing protein BrxF [Deltaproteobacteria bacterium CG03_land_8_20_14_0_80_45_14]